MIIVKVTYTVKPEFVQKNQENIRLFINDFKHLDSIEFRYNAYLCNDRKTFVHLSHYQNEMIQKTLLEVPSFKLFQEERDASGLEVSPQIDIMKAVESSHDIFN
jgi:hypothetical protein